MIITRNGKIARLPHEVREELNQRLINGKSGRALLAWLNQLPQVRAVLAAEFGGHPINAPNLTAWRHGGYKEWLMQREGRAMAETLGRETAGGGRGLKEVLALSLLGQYSVAVGQLPEARGQEGYQRRLRELCHDFVKLSRACSSLSRDPSKTKHAGPASLGESRPIKQI